MKNNLGKCEDVLRIIGESQMLLTYIGEVYRGDEARFKVLCNILMEMEHMEKEEMKCEIYQYGSMIKGDDLLARQLFLWLLGLTETLYAPGAKRGGTGNQRDRMCEAHVIVERD